MKKLRKYGLIITTGILLFSLTACKSKVPVNTDDINSGVIIDETKDVAEVDSKEVLNNFRNIVKDKDLVKVVKFVNENISKVDNIQADSMVYGLEDLMKVSLNHKLIGTDENAYLLSMEISDTFFPEDKIKEIKNEDLKKLITEIYNSNYKLINLEGNYESVIDYDKIKKYTKYTSEEVKDYIAIKVLDSNNPVAKDAALMIKYDELADRLIKTEKYIMQYYGSQRHEEMLKDYKNKIIIYLSGLPNTPIMDYTSNRIYDDVLNSYKKTSKIKDSSTAFIVNEYLNVIEENDLIMNKNVGNTVVSLVNKSLSLLEINK